MERSDMSLTADQVIIEALSLPVRVRAELAERLLTSLQGDERFQSEIDDAWRTEVAERCKAFNEGRIDSVPADQVMREAYEKLK